MADHEIEEPLYWPADHCTNHVGGDRCPSTSLYRSLLEWSSGIRSYLDQYVCPWSSLSHVALKRQACSIEAEVSFPWTDDLITEVDHHEGNLWVSHAETGN